MVFLFIIIIDRIECDLSHLKIITCLGCGYMNQSIKTLGFPELTHCSDNQILLKDLSITLMHQLVTSNVGDCWCSFTCYNFPVDNQNCLGVGKISGPFFYKLFFKFLFYWNSVDSAWHQGLSLCSNHSDLRMFHKIVLKKLCCSQQILNVLKIISEIRLNIDILYLFQWIFMEI